MPVYLLFPCLAYTNIYEAFSKGFLPILAAPGTWLIAEDFNKAFLRVSVFGDVFWTGCVSCQAVWETSDFRKAFWEGSWDDFCEEFWGGSWGNVLAETERKADDEGSGRTGKFAERARGVDIGSAGSTRCVFGDKGAHSQWYKLDIVESFVTFDLWNRLKIFSSFIAAKKPGTKGRNYLNTV